MAEGFGDGVVSRSAAPYLCSSYTAACPATCNDTYAADRTTLVERRSPTAQADGDGADQPVACAVQVCVCCAVPSRRRGRAREGAPHPSAYVSTEGTGHICVVRIAQQAPRKSDCRMQIAHSAAQATARIPRCEKRGNAAIETSAAAAATWHAPRTRHGCGAGC